MRVIAGEARKLKLIAPEGNDVRPTTDRTKETLYNMINSYVYNSVFLDLFSGSGAMGIEALSRGACKAYFVENSLKAQKCIEYNLKHTKLIEKSNILKYDYNRALNMFKDKEIKFDIIFLDPPYNKGFEEDAITKICSFDLLSDYGILICESASDTSFNFMNKAPNYVIYKEKKFKTSKFTFIKRA